MSATTIARVLGRRVWDSRGRPTVEAEIHLAGGGVGRAIAPAGASTGSGEAVDLRDGGAALGGMDVRRAVGHVGAEIAPALIGQDAADQAAVDRLLIALDGTPDKRRLGANALVAVSMAAAHAAAAGLGVPLWRHLGADAPRLACPEIQIVGGGAHAGARIDLQDIMVIPIGAGSIAEGFDWVAEVFRAAGVALAQSGRLQGVADEGGYWPAFDTNEEALAAVVAAIQAAGFVPGRDLALSLDIASTQLLAEGRYHLRREGRRFDRAGWLALLQDWIARYAVVAIEDPFAETDDEGMAAITAAIGGQALVIGDDYVVTNAERIARAGAAGAINAVLVKPNQAGTLTEAKAAFDAARAAGMAAIVSARSGESEDVTIVHLAAGWGADLLKVGSFSRSERMAKWNECLRLAETPGASFAGWPPVRPTR